MSAIHKSTRAPQRPGTILAENKETGVLFRIREEMLDIPGHPWINIEDPDTVESIELEEIVTDPNIIMTKAGKPFRTERAARTAMTAKKLSDHEWIIIPSDDGFIISKV